MNTIEGKYLEDLRCEMKHLKSGVLIHTDAPIDNNGKGESFSPTDLLAAALGSCMLTILAIRANTKRIDIGTPNYTIKKIMDANPRRVKAIEIEISFEKSILLDDRKYLENEALNCPVALSLSKDLEQKVTFKYN